jgi:hypothetical protein
MLFINSISGVDTKEIMETVAGSVRSFLFGTHVHIKYKRDDGKEKFVLLPPPKGQFFASFCPFNLFFHSHFE